MADINQPVPEPDARRILAIPRQTRLDIIEQLSIGLAHELRTPLTIIRNAAHVLRKSSSLSSQDRDVVDMINRETRAMETVISTLIEITHPGEPRRVEVDLKAVVMDAASEFDVRDGVKWELDLVPQPFIIRCDLSQFRQVFRNIFKNAIQAMKCRGEIRIVARGDGKSVQIDVCDSGPGIPDALREHLFEPLGTLSKRASGLGLAFCNRVIQSHGGTISWLEDRRPGAAFQIKLPQA